MRSKTIWEKPSRNHSNRNYPIGTSESGIIEERLKNKSAYHVQKDDRLRSLAVEKVNENSKTENKNWN